VIIMAQLVYKQRTAVKRMDEVAREQEQRDHEELMSRARRASRKAHHATVLAMELVDEINKVV
jgi:hypothetical protein